MTSDRCVAGVTANQFHFSDDLLLKGAIVAGVGWAKLANNSDSAIVAFTTLGANARQTQGFVSYRQEADNMVHEMYVW